MANAFEDIDEKKKRQQANQGSKSIQNGNANVFRGQSLPTREGVQVGLQQKEIGLGGGRMTPEGAQRLRESGQELGLGQTTVVDPRALPRDYLGRPIGGATNVAAAVSPRPIAQTPTVGGSAVPGPTYTLMSSDASGDIFKTEFLPGSRNEAMYGKALYARKPFGVEGLDPNKPVAFTQGAPSGTGGIGRSSTSFTSIQSNAIPGGDVGGTGGFTAVETPQQQQARQFAEGDVFSYGAVGDTYRRLSQQRHQLDLARSRGEISPGRHAQATAALNEQEFGLRTMIQSQQDIAGAAKAKGEADIAIQRIKSANERIGDQTLSAKDKAELELERDKWAQELLFKYYDTGMRNTMGAQTLEKVYSDTLRETNDTAKAQAAMRQYLKDNIDLFSNEVKATQATEQALGESQAKRDMSLDKYLKPNQ